jgi:hypothetical protein
MHESVHGRSEVCLPSHISNYPPHMDLKLEFDLDADVVPDLLWTKSRCTSRSRSKSRSEATGGQ